MPRSKTAERVYQEIREGIMAGRLPGGTRLKEMMLAAQVKASRTPIREALVQLQSEGLVVLLPNRGATVRALDEREVEDAFQLRALLEGYGAAHAAHLLTWEEIDALERLCDEMEAAERAQNPMAIGFILERNDRFHQMILETSGNRRLTAAVRAAMEIPRIYRTHYWHSDRERRRAFRFHRELVEAFRRRDPLWAEATMKSHIHAARDYLVAKLRGARLDGPAEAPPELMRGQAGGEVDSSGVGGPGVRSFDTPRSKGSTSEQ